MYDILIDFRGLIFVFFLFFLRGVFFLVVLFLLNMGKGFRRFLLIVEVIIYGKGWVFINLDFVLDYMYGFFWCVWFDLEVYLFVII